MAEREPANPHIVQRLNNPKETELEQGARVYTEFADEDQLLAEMGMDDYDQGLLAEDAR